MKKKLLLLLGLVSSMPILGMEGGRYSLGELKNKLEEKIKKRDTKASNWQRKFQTADLLTQKLIQEQDQAESEKIENELELTLGQATELNQQIIQLTREIHDLEEKIEEDGTNNYF